MSWREFSYLLEGLSGTTPLGRVVSIRAEKNPAELNERERQIRNEYLAKQASHKTTKQIDDVLESIKNSLVGMSK